MARKEKVSGHFRRDRKGKRVKVKPFKRKAKPKGSRGIHIGFKKKFEVIQYVDDQGRIVSKRRYRPLS